MLCFALLKTREIYNFTPYKCKRHRGPKRTNLDWSTNVGHVLYLNVEHHAIQMLEPKLTLERSASTDHLRHHNVSLTPYKHRNHLVSNMSSERLALISRIFFFQLKLLLMSSNYDSDSEN